MKLCGDTALQQDIVQTLLFTIIAEFFELIIGMPAKIYRTFVIQEKWGFNKTTASTFICD
jgi:STE24 endopeptidase